MISDYEVLEEGFNKKIMRLQETCPHVKSEWMEEYWAVGHSTGCQVRVCLNCNKTLERKEPKQVWEIKYEGGVK